MNIAHAGTDPDLVGRSIMTDTSVNKVFRKDGSLIKTSYLHQTKGFAPKEFNKKEFGKTITLKYNATKFRRDFKPNDSPSASKLDVKASKVGLDKLNKLDESSTMLEPMRSTFLSTTKLRPEPHANPPSPSRHQVHKTEEIHRPDSRAFLKDPHWSRSDIYASMRNFRENSVTPEVSPDRILIYSVTNRINFRAGETDSNPQASLESDLEGLRNEQKA